MTSFEQALLLHQNGQFQEAIRAYLMLIRQNPSAELSYNLGMAYWKMSDFDSAILAFDNALKLRPDYPIAECNLALVYWQKGDLFKTEKQFLHILSEDPWNIDILVNLANVYLQQGRPEKGIQRLQPLMSQLKHHPIAWDCFGACWLDSGDLQMAQACFHRAHTQDGANPEIVVHLLAPIHDLQDSSLSKSFLLQSTLQFPQHWTLTFYQYFMDCWEGKTVIPPLNTPDFCIDSVQYMLSHKTPHTRIFWTVAKTLEYAVQQAHLDGWILEFGVRFGTSIRMLQKYSQQRIVGFDSFQGLPIAWHEVPEGAYSTQGFVPDLGDNISCVDGWYSESLGPFVRQHLLPTKKPIRLLHIDCDLYESTHEVLIEIAPFLQEGSVIIFDEYWMSPHWKEDEWLAWQECCARHNIEYHYLAISFVTRQAVVYIDYIQHSPPISTQTNL